MKQQIVNVALLVIDYDEAIDFYVNKLHFDLVEDSKLSESKRWVVVRPKGTSGMALLLAKASNERQLKSVGNQSGGRVFLFLHTDDFERDYNNLLEHSIKVIREPATEEWGKVCVFEDIYGNLWDLIEPAKK